MKRIYAMKYLNFAVTATILLLLYGCGNYTDHFLLRQTPLPPSPEKQFIEILDERPSRPFEKIAKLEVSQGYNFDSYNDLRNDLVDEARKVGADAIIDISMGSHGVGAMVPSANGSIVGGYGEYKTMFGTAIKYK